MRLFLENRLNMFETLPSVVFPTKACGCDTSPGFKIRNTAVLGRNGIGLHCANMSEKVVLSKKSNTKMGVAKLAFKGKRNFVVRTPDATSVNVRVRGICLDGVATQY